MIKFTINYELLEKCFCVGDLYKVLGLYEYMRSGELNNVSQIKANSKTNDKLLELFTKNAYKSRDKRLRGLRKKYKESYIRFDFACYAPTNDDSVEEDCICIVLNKKQDNNTCATQN